MKKLIAYGLAATILGVFLAGCSGGSSDSGTTASTGSTATAGSTAGGTSTTTGK